MQWLHTPWMSESYLCFSLSLAFQTERHTHTFLNWSSPSDALHLRKRILFPSFLSLSFCEVRTLKRLFHQQPLIHLSFLFLSLSLTHSALYLHLSVPIGTTLIPCKKLAWGHQAGVTAKQGWGGGKITPSLHRFFLILLWTVWPDWAIFLHFW